MPADRELSFQTRGEEQGSQDWTSPILTPGVADNTFKELCPNPSRSPNGSGKLSFSPLHKLQRIHFEEPGAYLTQTLTLCFVQSPITNDRSKASRTYSWAPAP